MGILGPGLILLEMHVKNMEFTVMQVLAAEST